MKRLSLLLILMVLGFSCFAQNVVAVLEFETKDADIRDKMSLLTDIFRSELANTKNLNVVDRANTDKVLDEIALQQSSMMSSTNVKTVGSMLNADYIVIGTVAVLKDDAEEITTYTTREEEVDGGALGSLGKFFLGDKGTSTKTVVDEKTQIVQEKRINVVVQLINVETGGILAASRIDVPKWSEFSKYASSLAEELSVTLGKKSTTLKKVDANMFYGTWECEIFYNNIVDYYTVEFDDNNRVKVTVESTSRSGKTTKSSGSGRFVYSEDDKVFSLTVNRMSGSVKHVERISWKSIVNPSKDNNSFTMTIPTATSGGQKVRGEFYRID